MAKMIDKGDWCYCSHCETVFNYDELGWWLADFNFCPICGAKLEEINWGEILP